MSKDSFKVKKGLSIIPVDPTTLVSPEAGDLVVDSTDNNKLKSYDPISATFKQVKGTGGGINYLENGDAESGLSGWSTYADAAGANAVDGTGGTANITLTLNDVTPLRGTNDFLITKDAANRQGEGISIPFTIDSADTAKKLYISLDFLSSANLADGDIRIQVYDVTNSRLIRCNGEDLNGTKGSHLAWFQSDAASVSYRLILHVSTVNALAYTLNLDNVSVGPREVSYGGAMTDWVDRGVIPFKGSVSDPTKGTTIIDSWSTRRVGSNLEIIGNYHQNTSGTAGSGFYYIELPDGLKADLNVVKQSSAVIAGKLGDGLWTGVASYEAPFIITLSGTGDTQLIFQLTASVSSDLRTQLDAISNANAGLSNATSAFTFKASVPIQGWSSNSVQSEDIGNREVRVRGAGNAGGSVTSLVTNIDFSETEDTSASFNGTQFTAPESGDYHVSGMVRFTSSASREIIAYVNGSALKLLGQMTSSDRVPFSGVVPLLKGQILSFRTDITSTLQNTSTVHTLHIQKLAQPQTILETETVAARYTSNSGQSIVTSGTVLVYEDKVQDTHGGYNASNGQYIIPVNGWYQVNAGYRASASTSYSIDVFVGGSSVFGLINQLSSTGSILMSYCDYFTKGQIITIVASPNSNTTLVAATERNTFSIARIK